jgi:hypothetical protein
VGEDYEEAYNVTLLSALVAGLGLGFAGAIAGLLGGVIMCSFRRATETQNSRRDPLVHLREVTVANRIQDQIRETRATTVKLTVIAAQQPFYQTPAMSGTVLN